MKRNISYKKSVTRDFKQIDYKERLKIINEVENELSSNPKAGKPLHGVFKGLFSYRVGNYRIVYTTIPEGILILRIQHRKEVYR